MNTALFHAARPGDIGGGRCGDGGASDNRMRQAAAIAKKMGLGIGSNAEAANMWKMLDDLYATDSEAYEEMAKASRDEMVSA